MKAIILIMCLFALLMVSGCLTVGQSIDKGINETVNITGNIFEGIKGWFNT